MRVITLLALLLILIACTVPGQAGEVAGERRVPRGPATQPVVLPTTALPAQARNVPGPLSYLPPDMPLAPDRLREVLKQITPSPDDLTGTPPVKPTATPPPSPTSPTATPSPTPVPLTEAAMTACPVTLPNGWVPPSSRHWFGLGEKNAYGDGMLWTGLPKKGVLLIGDPFVRSDGVIGMKWPWFRRIRGVVTIDGRRLDVPAPPMPTVTLRGPADGYGETGFHPSGLLFPTEGCWEVTASVGDHSLTFVTLVVKAPFEPLRARWLPAGLRYVETDFTLPPDAIWEIYRFADARAGKLIVETARGEGETLNPYAGAVQQPVTVYGQPGICVRVGWDEVSQWRADPDAGVLAWTDEGIRYRIRHTGLGLSCEDLLRVAGPPP